MDYKRTYYIIFTARKNYTFWNWMLDKELYHCAIATAAGENGTTYISVSSGGISVHHYDLSIVDWVREYITRTGNFNIIRTECHDMETPRIKGFRTCVSICKDFIGLNRWNILTSKQLYNYLTKHL